MIAMLNYKQINYNFISYYLKYMVHFLKTLYYIDGVLNHTKQNVKFKFGNCNYKLIKCYSSFWTGFSWIDLKIWFYKICETTFEYSNNIIYTQIFLNSLNSLDPIGNINW
jgi:hypothetical protein